MCSLLGVRVGFIALNKVDLVEDPEWLELVEADVAASVEGTFLEGCPILRCSASTGEGVDDIRSAIFALAGSVEDRQSDGLLRLPMDRVFTMHGFGTVVTGTLIAGTVTLGDDLVASPLDMGGKVRGIQAYHEKADSARAGHCTALNLSDVDHHAVERGQIVVTPGFFTPVMMVGARLTALADLDRPITNRMRVRVHAGTSEAVGEIVLLDAEELAPGAEGLVQFRAEHPLVCANATNNGGEAAPSPSLDTAR